MAARIRCRSQSGFSLVETLVALTILLTCVVSLSQLFSVAASATQGAARRTLAAIAARDKLEQLRTTTWTALIPSPAGTLQADIHGFSDRLDGDGARPMLLRRWSITPIAADPARLMVLTVLILGPGGRIEAHITTIRRREGV